MDKHKIVETVKTIVIVALIVGIVAFVAGVHYEQSQTKANNQTVQAQVKSLK